MLIPSNIHPLIKEQLERTGIFEDFSIMAHSGDGEWVDLIDMKEFIHVGLKLREGNVYATVNANIRGFSGVLESYEWCLPNDMLHRSIMQILTILEFLPRDENINDLEYKVHARWLKEAQKLRGDRKACILEEIQKAVTNLTSEGYTDARALLKIATQYAGEDATLQKKINNADSCKTMESILVNALYKRRFNKDN